MSRRVDQIPFALDLVVVGSLSLLGVSLILLGRRLWAA